MGLARQALDAYLLKLNTYPLRLVFILMLTRWCFEPVFLKSISWKLFVRMQLITGTMIGYAGDAIAQLWIEKSKKYDFKRGTRMAAFRFFLLTPLENRWWVWKSQVLSKSLIYLYNGIIEDDFRRKKIHWKNFVQSNEKGFDWPVYDRTYFNDVLFYI